MMSHAVEGRARRPSSRAGTPGAPPAPLIARRRGLLALLFLLFISRLFFGLGGGALDRVLHDLARHGIDVDFVEAVRSLDVEGIDQASFFAFNLFRLNFARFLGQGGLLRLLHGDLRFFAQSSLAGLALAAAPC